MKNQFNYFVEAYHKMNFQVRHSGHGSIIFPDTFSLGSYKYLLGLHRSDKKTLPTHPGIYPQNLFIIERLTLK